VQTAAPPLLVSVIATVPVGVPAPGDTGATVAVKVTDCPKVEGFETDVSVVLELAWFTVCDTLPLEPEWLLSPAYVAVTGSLPTGNEEVVQVAIPG
jgi:hypothetical protein